MSTNKKAIPVGELTVCEACLCTITGFSCGWPDCFGCGTDGVCTCFKSNMLCCKMMNSDDNMDNKMFLCAEGGMFLVKPDSCIACQEQVCCLDTRCAIPCTDEVPMMCTLLPGCVVYPAFACCSKAKDIMKIEPRKMAEVPGRNFDLSDVDVGGVRVCEACCCSICGFIFTYPQCCGCKQEGTCICFQGEQSLCKPITMSNDEHIFCICCDGGCYLVEPRTCIQVTETCFCIDSRCAIPCTDKVPCMCTFFPGCVVCAKKEIKLGCFPLVEDMIPDLKVTPEPPEQVVM